MDPRRAPAYALWSVIPLPIAGGLDIHRKQITFDYLDTETAHVRRGQMRGPGTDGAPAAAARGRGGAASRSGTAMAASRMTRFLMARLLSLARPRHPAQTSETRPAPGPPQCRWPPESDFGMLPPATAFQYAVTWVPVSATW